MIFETNLERLLCTVDEPLYYSREELNTHRTVFDYYYHNYLLNERYFFFYDGCLLAKLARIRTEDHRLSESPDV